MIRPLLLAAIVSIPVEHAEAIRLATTSPVEQRALRELGRGESAWDDRVLSGRCDLLPHPTKVCDFSIRLGVYRARGAYQLHEVACPEAFKLPAGSVESIRVETKCALSQLRYHGERCARHSSALPRFPQAERFAIWWVGAFAGYASGGAVCDTKQARARALEVVR